MLYTVLLLFLLFLGSSRGVIFKNRHYVCESRLAFVTSSQIGTFLVQNQLQFETLQAEGLPQTFQLGHHFMQNHVSYNNNNLVSRRRYTKVCESYEGLFSCVQFAGRMKMTSLY